MTLKVKNSSGKSATHTIVHFILDETGSMANAWDPTIDGFNEYVSGLQADKESTYSLSLTKFEGGRLYPVHTNMPINDVPKLTRKTYCPAGMTNLNDAIGFTIKGMDKTLTESQKQDSNVLIIVLTDGMENCSQEWNSNTIKELIGEKEKDGWTVTFLGANMDAQAVSQSYGISSNNARSFSTSSMKGTMARAAVATSMYASSATRGLTSNDVFSVESTGLTDADWASEGEDALGSINLGSTNTTSKLSKEDEIEAVSSAAKASMFGANTTSSKDDKEVDNG